MIGSLEEGPATVEMFRRAFAGEPVALALVIGTVLVFGFLALAYYRAGRVPSP